MKLDILSRKPLNALVLNAISEHDDFQERFGINCSLEIPGIVDFEVIAKVNGKEINIEKEFKNFINTTIENIDTYIEEKAKELVKDKLRELNDITQSLIESATYMELNNV